MQDDHEAFHVAAKYIQYRRLCGSTYAEIREQIEPGTPINYTDPGYADEYRQCLAVVARKWREMQ